MENIYTYAIQPNSIFNDEKKMQPHNIPISDATAGKNDHHESNKKDDQERAMGRLSGL
jgi:hypothetical protein